MQDLTTFIAHHPGLFSLLAIVFVLIVVLEMLKAKRNVVRLDTAKAIQLINRENAVIVDIRSKEAYTQGHIIDAQSFPAKEVLDAPKKIEKFKNRPIIVVCNVGLESQKVAAQLLKQGYNVYALSGGTRAWSEAGMPIVKG